MSQELEVPETRTDDQAGEQSEKIGELAKALALAQSEIIPPKKSRTVTVKTEKGSYSYAYADLADIIECYRKPLCDHGLALTQSMRMKDGQLILSTKLLHESDQWLASDYPITTYNRPQEQGSAITYARRYAVTALLGIAAEEDDDGQAAQNATPKYPEKYAQAVKPSPSKTPAIPREPGDEEYFLTDPPEEPVEKAAREAAEIFTPPKAARPPSRRSDGPPRNAPPCPDCGKQPYPSKFPKEGAEFFCGRCKRTVSASGGL